MIQSEILNLIHRYIDHDQNLFIAVLSHWGNRLQYAIKDLSFNLIYDLIHDFEDNGQNLFT